MSMEYETFKGSIPFFKKTETRTNEKKILEEIDCKEKNKNENQNQPTCN